MSLIFTILFTITFCKYAVYSLPHKVFPYRVDLCAPDLGVYCMGVYLKDVWALTTLDCVSVGYFTNSAEVVIGNTHHSCESGERRIIMNITHEDDNPSDVVLLELSHPFESIDSSLTAIVDRRDAEDLERETCIVYSYLYQKDTSLEPEELRVFNVDVIEDAACIKTFPNFKYNSLVNQCGRILPHLEVSSSPFICNGTLVGIVIQKSIVELLIFKIKHNIIWLTSARRRSFDYTAAQSNLTAASFMFTLFFYVYVCVLS